MVMMRQDGPMDPSQRMTRFQRRGFARVPPSPGVAMGRTGRPPEATPKLPMPTLPPWMMSPGRPMEPAPGPALGRPMEPAPGGPLPGPIDSPPQIGGELGQAPGLPTDRPTEFMNPRDQFTGGPAPEKLPMPRLPPGIGQQDFAPVSAPLGDKYTGRPRPRLMRPREEDPSRQLY